MINADAIFRIFPLYSTEDLKAIRNTLMVELSQKPFVDAEYFEVENVTQIILVELDARSKA